MACCLLVAREAESRKPIRLWTCTAPEWAEHETALLLQPRLQKAAR